MVSLGGQVLHIGRTYYVAIDGVRHSFARREGLIGDPVTVLYLI
jgi:hypothetical protein